MLDTGVDEPHAGLVPDVETGRQPAVVGVADHSGWANLVTIGADGGRPVVVDRRRCELVDPDVPRQPYHAAEGLPVDEAEALVARVTAAAAAGARAALASLVADLDGHAAVALTVRAAGGRPLPDTVAGVLASHTAMHGAEGRLYRDALADAAAERGLAVGSYARGTAGPQAAASLDLSPTALEALVADLGRPLGPPWRAEHREAATAALCELAARAELGVRA